MRGNRPAKPTQGITLVELLIAMGLTSLVAVAILAVAQVHTAIQQEDRLSSQILLNARAGIEELATSLKSCGAASITGMVQNAVPPANPAMLPVVNVVNNATGAANSDGPDELQVLKINTRTTLTLLEPASEVNPFLRVNVDGGLKNGDYFVVTDLGEGSVYRLVRDPTAMTLDGIPAFELAFDKPPLPTLPDFIQGAFGFSVQPISYRIDTQILGGRPALVLQDGAPLQAGGPINLVAEDIFDMQVAVGVDGLRSGVATGDLDELGQAKDDDDWVYNFPGETLPNPLPAASRIALIRITLVARSGLESSQRGPGRPAIEDRPAGPPDRYRWRVLSTTLALKPLVAQP